MHIRLIVFLLVALAIYLLLPACKTPAAYPATAEVKFLDNPAAGLIRVEATGYGTTDKDAELDVFNTAFNTLLFKGLPGFSATQKPMLSDESKARSENAAYFKKFFTDRGYMQFVTEQNPAVAAGKADDKKNRLARRTFTINYEALRHDLEKNKLIRKFGL